MSPPMNGPTTPIVEVAKGLSAAQRTALWIDLAVDGDPAIPYFTGASCRCALQRKGIVVDRMYETKLTPLGIELRAHLLATQVPGPISNERGDGM